ncbi:hypothetical protein B0H15DRAFT_1026469 [Mycena belliarum]|uniref:Uncharacterized protein n=1 Tax=Mycena belliarum TaxID=1033014 RepID=A0AAD6XK34_9AGAR|nr:hypothetical protein B0H15DRAFT_1026469 [Mycena belliae]
MFNPYAQGGWKNTENPHAGSSCRNVPQPSIFGALPYPTLVTPPTFHSFRFTSCNPTILHSDVIGPQARRYFRVDTDSPAAGYTIIHSACSQPVAIIEWACHPIIEIRDIVAKQPTAEWLALSPDRTYRKMTANGKMFVWAPDGDYISLYSSGLGSPQLYARVLREEEDVALDLTAEAIQIGLLEICVAAALLLQSGRKID